MRGKARTTVKVLRIGHAAAGALTQKMSEKSQIPESVQAFWCTLFVPTIENSRFEAQILLCSLRARLAQQSPPRSQTEKRHQDVI